MKKLFTLFTTILFAGSMFATTYTATPSGTVTKSGGTIKWSNVTWTYGSAEYLAISSNEVQIGSKNNPQTSGWTISTPVSSFGENQKITSIAIKARTGGDGSYKISAGGSSVKSGDLSSSSTTYTASDLEVTSGSIEITITGSSKAAYLGTITIVYEEYNPDPTAPSITAANINLGTVQTLIGTKFEKDIELDIVGANLTEAIAYEASSEALTLSGTLTAEGGKLNVHIAAPVGDFSETITLTSGTASKTVKVTGKVEGVKPILEYTVAEALAAYAAETLEEGDSMIVRGVVKEIEDYYGTMYITLKDASDATKTFELNGLLSINGAELTYKDGIVEDANGYKFAEGDTLLAKGTFYLDYSNNPGLNYDCFLTAIYRDETDLTPEILATPKTIALESNEAAAGQKVTVVYNYWKVAVEEAEATLFSDAECTQNITLGGWISNFAFNENYTELTFDIAANEGKTRTAYIRIYAMGADAETEAQVVVKVTQAAKVIVNSYKLTDFADIQATDEVIITMKSGSKFYALSSANGTTKTSDAIEVAVSNDAISVSNDKQIFWNIVKGENNQFVVNVADDASTWLYCINDSKGLRVGTDKDNKTFTIKSEYIYSVNQSRFIGVYSGSDWRSYTGTSIHTNIAGETLGFYVLDNGSGTSLDNTASDTKAVKTIVNGQLIIEKAGVKYNVLGQTIR